MAFIGSRTNTHIYEIRVGDVGWGMTDPDWARVRSTPAKPASSTRSRIPRFYDFGDGWEHTIKVERLIGSQPGLIYPRLIEATRRCLPEDVGGP